MSRCHGRVTRDAVTCHGGCHARVTPSRPDPTRIYLPRLFAAKGQVVNRYAIDAPRSPYRTRAVVTNRG